MTASRNDRIDARARRNIALLFDSELSTAELQADWELVNVSHAAHLRSTPEANIDAGWPSLDTFMGEVAEEAEPLTDFSASEGVVERFEAMESAKKPAEQFTTFEPPEVVEIEKSEPEPEETIPEEVLEIVKDALEEGEEAFSLTPQELMAKLVKKYAAEKGAEEHWRKHGDMTQAMIHLNNAERLDTGINWNRPRLAEQVG